MPWRESIRQKHPFQVYPSLQIGEDHFLPLFNQIFRRFGKAVTGQVDQKQFVGQVKIVQLLGASRRVGRFGQSFAAGKRVDQARLADVGTAGKSDFFHLVVWRQLV